MKFLLDSKIRIINIVALLLLGFVPALLAQKTSETQTSTATVRVQTSLVVVPAIITDRQGNPVEDLGKNDFILKEDGKPQTISVFEHIQRQPGIDVKIPVPEGVYTNRVKQNQPARLTIIGVDAVSTGMLEKLETRKQILEFISKNVSLEQPVALFLLQESGVKVLHDFSTDPRVLIAALDHIVGSRTAADAIVHDQQTANERTAQGEKMKAVFDDMVRAETDTIQTSFLSFTNLQQKRMFTDTLESFHTIAQAFSGIPGRKSLIWITNGNSLDFGEAEAVATMNAQSALSSTSGLHFGSGMGPTGGPAPQPSMIDSNLGYQMQPYFERVWHALNSANIAVYPLDISDLANPGYIDPRLQHRAALNRPTAPTFNMEQMAAETGGSACSRLTDLDNCFKRASHDSEDYYLLAYYPDSNNPKKDWRKIEVLVDRKELKIRARNGYFPRTSAKTTDDEKQIVSETLTALGSPLDYTSLPLEVKINEIKPVDGNPDKRRANFSFFVPPTADFISGKDYRINLEFAALAKQSDGRPSGQFSTRAAGALKPEAAADIGIHGIVMPGSIDLGRGEYQIRFVVRDNQTARMGSVTVPVKIGEPVK